MTESSPPSAADWPTIKALFEQVLEQPAEKQEAWLQAQADAGAVSAEVLAEVRRLLANWEGDDWGAALWDSPGHAALGATPRPAARGAALAPGSRLGAWEILGPLGQGGMADVLLARRADGAWEGQAAIKLLKPGMDSAAVLARFALEQRALARLNHPHIARLLDAGRTAAGAPYFVMELVDGVPIDVACVGKSLEARLGLFLQLAAAVSFAHRQLLVHRDLKPSNVLVTAQDQVKLLDFGIAKALDPTDTADPGQTAIGQRPYTPSFASPEQVRGDPVDTATDLYSLGVLLYVMLTGQRPYGRQAQTPMEAVISVLEEEPTRPSALSAEEATDPQWLQQRKRLEGDLDNILLKALRKEREERYPSVDALAADVRAHLQGYPVSAHPPGLAYLAGRFVRRNRAASALTALLLASIVGGSGAALWQAHAARLARDDAQRHLADTRRLANAMIFEVNSALQSGATEGRRVLVKTAADYLERQAQAGANSDAEVMELAHALNDLARLEGHAYADNVGDPDNALVHYQRALDLLEPLRPRQDGNADWHGTLVSSLEGRSSILRSQHRLEAAYAAMQQTSEHADRAAALKPDDLKLRVFQCAALIELSSHNYMGSREHGLNRMDLALTQAKAARACGERLVALAPGQPRSWKLHCYALRVHGNMLAFFGDMEGELAAARLSLAAADKALSLPGGEPMRPALYVGAHLQLGLALLQVGQEPEAREQLKLALEAAAAQAKADPTNQRLRAEYMQNLTSTLDHGLRYGQLDSLPAHYERLSRLLDQPGSESLAEAERDARLGLKAVQALVWYRLGQRGKGDALAQELRLAFANRPLPTEPHVVHGEAELRLTVYTALAEAAARAGHMKDYLAASRAARESADTLQRSRDPRDAVEALLAVENLTRLAQTEVGSDKEAQRWRAGLVADARRIEADLVSRKVLVPGSRPEATWLAAQAL